MSRNWGWGLAGDRLFGILSSPIGLYEVVRQMCSRLVLYFSTSFNLKWLSKTFIFAAKSRSGIMVNKVDVGIFCRRRA